MGGFGSGTNSHWWRPRKKTTVEDCDALNANRWMREGILKAGVHHSGSWRWTFRDRKEESIDVEVDTRDLSSPFVRLTYWSIPIDPEERETFDYRVRLATTEPRFGGVRWWFLCPLLVHGTPCNRRVGKLYMPPGGSLFGCRHCEGRRQAGALSGKRPRILLEEIKRRCPWRRATRSHRHTKEGT